MPSPQKGPDVTLSMSGGSDLPVYVKADTIPDDLIDWSAQPSYKVKNGFPSGDTRHMFLEGASSSGTAYTKGYVSPAISGAGNSFQIAPNNLWAQSDGASVATINQLRLAFATQQLYELDARGGTRYVEILKAHFGVTSPDARQQRPELLAYNHTPININQVVQQSGTNTTTALGDVAGLSLQIRIILLLSLLQNMDLLLVLPVFVINIVISKESIVCGHVKHGSIIIGLFLLILVNNLS